MRGGEVVERMAWGLQYDQSGEELVQELKLSGPLVGVAFRW